MSDANRAGGGAPTGEIDWVGAALPQKSIMPPPVGAAPARRCGAGTIAPGAALAQKSISPQATHHTRRSSLSFILGRVAISPDIRAAAPEYLVDDHPVPASVEDERAPMEQAYPDEPPLPSAFPRLRQRLDTATPFWRDTSLRLHPRAYYFDRDRENANNSVAVFRIARRR